MKKLQWVKRTAILTDVPMAYLLNLGDAYVVIWYMLEDLAALINDDGKIYISPNQPMDIKFLAKLLQRRVSQLEKALDVYESIDLISRDERGNITLLTWHKIQDYARLEKQRAQNRERQAAYRQRQSELQAKQDVLVTETYEPASAGAVSLQPVGGGAGLFGPQTDDRREYGDGCQNGQQRRSDLHGNGVSRRRSGSLRGAF